MHHNFYILAIGLSDKKALENEANSYKLDEEHI